MTPQEWIKMVIEDYKKISRYDEAGVAEYILEHAPWHESRSYRERIAQLEAILSKIEEMAHYSNDKKTLIDIELFIIKSRKVINV